MRKLGTLELEGNEWILSAEPHVVQMAKRIFPRIDSTQTKTVRITSTPAIARDLEWFALRYPLTIKNEQELQRLSREHIEAIEHKDNVLTGKVKPRTFKLAVPPREYQSQAAEIMISQKAMILGDEIGLGKTCTSICCLAQKQCQPAVVVCLAHLPDQWKREINRFIPKATVRIAERQQPHDVKNRKGEWPNILIISYSKLRYWADVIKEHCRTVVYDEIQELRRPESLKHQAAVSISAAMEYRFGLTNSPVYNFGGEFFNVFKAIDPDQLGTETEFLRERCDSTAMSAKPKLNDPKAFGSWLKENHLMLRRVRKEVDRELPKFTRVLHFVETDSEEFKKSEDRAKELARIILESTAKGAQFTAAGEFDALMRQATGISKAAGVADFVEMILETGEPVVLYGWHKAVYALWEKRLEKYKPAFYTGAESTTKKNKELDRFINGETDLMIMSLRSGVGVDGLQHRCRTVVIGEFDWSPAVIEQDIGRVYRDGQKDPVTAYLLAVDSGSDPFMMEVLGIKQDQLAGIRVDQTFLDKKPDSLAILKKLARQFLDKNNLRTGAQIKNSR
mgnify:CR=1 FL=1